MRQLIIRADDLGYSEAVNYGILKTVKEGLVSSVGVMPNMPSAKQGLQLLEGTKVGIGQHTNICLGKPCANPNLIPSMLDENGNFHSSKAFREAYKEGKELIKLDEAVIEIEAQYLRFKELTGRKPDYFEAHAVVSENLGKALAIVAKKYDLPFNDINPMVENGMFRGKPIHTLPFGAFAKDYDPLSCLQDGILHHFSEDMPNVAIFHPGYLDDYILTHSSLTINRTKEVVMLTDIKTKEWLNKENIELISYKQANL